MSDRTAHDHQHFSSDDEERLHFQKIVESYRSYGSFAKQRVNIAIKNYKKLPEYQQDLVKDFLPNCAKLFQCIEHNQNLINLLLEDVHAMFHNEEFQKVDKDGDGNDLNNEAIFKRRFYDLDIDKVFTTLRQINRDWSSEGADERKSCYGPLAQDLMELYPDKCQRKDVSVLVPGAGLGRLAFDIANVGFRCQGNEFSLFMLIASNFILNRCPEVNEHVIYPWVHQWSNNFSAKDQTRAVKFPDVSPFDLDKDSQFSMAAGNFLEIYTEEGCDQF